MQNGIVWKRLFILKLDSFLLLPFRVVAVLHLTQLFVAVAILNAFELSDFFEMCSVWCGQVLRAVVSCVGTACIFRFLS